MLSYSYQDCELDNRIEKVSQWLCHASKFNTHNRFIQIGLRLHIWRIWVLRNEIRLWLCAFELGQRLTFSFWTNVRKQKSRGAFCSGESNQIIIQNGRTEEMWLSDYQYYLRESEWGIKRGKEILKVGPIIHSVRMGWKPVGWLFRARLNGSSRSAAGGQ